MGCPMCDWKTALLMVAGIALIFLSLGFYFSVLGVGLMIAAWVWAMWPNKTCRVEPGKSGTSGAGDSPTNE